MNNNTIPSRNDILSLQTESIDSVNYNSNYLMDSEMSGGKDRVSPGDVFHQESIDYLKNEMKLPEIEARAYKSIAYRKVKEMHPEANHLERAKLMLEAVKNKNFIKENKNKLAEVVKILETIDLEKKARQQEQVPTTETKSRRSKGSRAGSRKGSRRGSRAGSRSGSRKGSRKSSRKGSRKSQKGGAFDESQWPEKKPGYPLPTTPIDDLRDYLARIDEDIVPNMTRLGQSQLFGDILSDWVKKMNHKYNNIIRC